MATKTDTDNAFVPFGPIARGRLGIQAQYASRYVDGRGAFPCLGKGLRFEGDPVEYHSLQIHRDDVEEFVLRVSEHLERHFRQMP